MRQPVIFLDRDGTLVEEVNYLHRVEDLRVFPATKDALRELKGAGYLLIVVTNQSGIGREVYTEQDMHAIHEAMQQQLDGVIDAFYFCPHLPCDGCRCRKPEIGMIESAMADFEIDIQNSWMVGDKDIDVLVGQAAQLKTALVLTGYGLAHRETLQIQPEMVAEDFLAATKHIISAGK